MKTEKLSALEWELVGTKPYYWMLNEQMKEMVIKQPENSPVITHIPSSVQQALLDAGIIPDWNYGTNYRLIEWVENRHWLYFANLPDRYIQTEGQAILHCLGLDGDGEVWLNGQKVGEFNNTHLDYKFDLTHYLKPQNNRIGFVFFCPERYQGQVYWTSKTKLNKPRFYYNWDWCPRLVQIGVFDEITLQFINKAALGEFYTYTDYKVDNQQGVLQLKRTAGPILEKETIRVELFDKNGDCQWAKVYDGHSLELGVKERIIQVQCWQPNQEGEHYLYRLKFTLLSEDQTTLQIESRSVGFRSINWTPCQNAAIDADPWILNVNGKPLFMQGVNWTPIRAMFADVTEEMYRSLISKYKEIGVNLLRVWGGATLEKQCFYEICDEMGIMVWQEFPLSSSAICNTPPEDASSIEIMAKIVEGYIRRRHYHASLIAWSGGNELYNKDNSAPLDFNHPLLARSKSVCEQLDPIHRMMPTSPSGPTIYYDPTLNGKGLQ